jgi:hypothetical protein
VVTNIKKLRGGQDMVIKKNGIDFTSKSGALTIDTIHLGTHEDGWTITGKVHEDYYQWINEFEAVHPKYGKVYGDFEANVYADTEEGFQHFYENHTPISWDYGDI